ncbi:MAG: RagB/SusD family nutrient uptake outer membrane protein [Muribaculaceae bacterium]|nr:RagB/SusD family nutrient uptake outer membrane protein [Muribaculaceae bacterium]
MKKIIYPILAGALLCGSAMSCTDELNIEQKGIYDSQTFYSTDQEVDGGLALAMNYVVNMAYQAIISLNCLSDDVWAGGANSGDQPTLHQYNGFYISTENNDTKKFYSYCYRLIYFANVLIEGVGNKDPETVTPHMKQCVAEAYFLRGWAEFYLAALWGNPPIVDHVLTESEYHVSNSEYGAMFDQAAKDFQTAIEMGLPEKPALGDMTNNAHCTLAAAQAFLGKVYLFQGKYPEAAAMLDNIITSGKYALWDGPYEDIIKAASNWSDEGVFEVNCPPNQADVTAVPNMSYVYIYTGWRNGDGGFNFDNLDTEVFSNFNTTGYGFCNPQGKLAEAFIKSDGAGSYRMTSVLKDQDFVNNVMGVNITPSATIHGHGLYCGWKNRWQFTDISMDWGWSPFPATNFRFMRYAEVLLSAAEAYFQSGNTAKALDYVNQVRTRAQAELYTSIDLDKIKLERQVELCMEGQRFMDLVRWGDAEKELGTQGQDIEMVTIGADGKWTLVPDPASNPSYGFKPYNKYLPYPKEECDQNPNIKQHEGY